VMHLSLCCGINRLGNDRPFLASSLQHETVVFLGCTGERKRFIYNMISSRRFRYQTPETNLFGQVEYADDFKQLY
jgi:hypothetical protein